MMFITAAAQRIRNTVNAALHGSGYMTFGSSGFGGQWSSERPSRGALVVVRVPHQPLTKRNAQHLLDRHADR